MKHLKTFFCKQYFDVNEKPCFCYCPGRKSLMNFRFQKTCSDKVFSHPYRTFSGNFQEYLFIIADLAAMYFEGAPPSYAFLAV